MFKKITAIFAAAAISVQVVAAAPLTGSLTGGESAGRAAGVSLFSTLTSGLKASIATMRGQADYKSDKKSKQSLNGECPDKAAKPHSDSGSDKDQEQEPARPDPIYYGF